MNYLKQMFTHDLFPPEAGSEPLTQEQYVKSFSKYIQQDFKIHMFIAALSALLFFSFTAYFITGLFV